MIGLALKCLMTRVFKKEEKLLQRRKELYGLKNKFEEQVRHAKRNNEVSTAWYYLLDDVKSLNKKIDIIERALWQIEYNQRTLNGLIESSEIRNKLYNTDNSSKEK